MFSKAATNARCIWTPNRIMCVVDVHGAIFVNVFVWRRVNSVFIMNAVSDVGSFYCNIIKKKALTTRIHMKYRKFLIYSMIASCVVTNHFASACKVHLNAIA